MSELPTASQTEALDRAAEQALSDLGYALDELGCEPHHTRYIPVVGSAGKTTLVHMAAAVLQKAGFAVGCFLPGGPRLADCVTLNGVPADEHDCANLETVVDRCFAPEDRGEATRLACAAALFEQAGCDFALLELQQPALAQGLPAVAVLVGAIGEPEVKNARECARAFRAGVPTVAVPGQESLALQELTAAADAAGCTLLLPDAADLKAVTHRSMATVMDYGGYRVLLPNFGRHMAQDAAAVVELALALWRDYEIDIPDEAILEGLADYDPSAGPRVVLHKVLALADPCHTALQAAALSNALREAGLQQVNAVNALEQADDPESYYTALESGRLTAEITDKKQLPGMTDCPVDKVWLPSLFYGETPGDLRDAQELAQVARFHFDPWPTGWLDRVLSDAVRAEGDALLLCGPVAFVAQAERTLRMELAGDLLDGEAAPGDEPDYAAYRSSVMERFGALEDELTDEMAELLAESKTGDALYDDDFDPEADEAAAAEPQPFAYADTDEDWLLEPAAPEDDPLG